MLQVASTDHFNPLVPKTHNSGCQNVLFPLQTKQVKVNIELNWRIFSLWTLDTNGLRMPRRAAVGKGAGKIRRSVDAN